MFGLFKKKKKAKTEELLYRPSFGSHEDFVALYGKGKYLLPIGRKSSNNINVNVAQSPCKEITVINDVQKSADNQFILPLLKEKTLSYVVYDPENTYQVKLRQLMEDAGYDTQIVDFGDEKHRSRIDLFEITNITRNAYWLSVILAGSIKCTPKEIPVAHALFMAMMQYLITTKEKVDIISLYKVFKKVKDGDKEMFNEIQLCTTARGEMVKVWQASHDVKASVYEKITNNFFRTALTKSKDANIFATTAHKGKTIYFIKKAPQRYTYLTTTLLFNLKVANVLFNKGETSAVIIDTADDKWYNKEVVREIEKEIGPNTGIVNIHIRPSIGTPQNPYIRDNQLVLFMQSEDEATKKYVSHCLKTKQLLDAAELAKLKKDFELKNNSKKKKKKKKDVEPEQSFDELLEMTALSFEDMDRMMDMIVIDMSKQTKPFRCDRLV